MQTHTIFQQPWWLDATAPGHWDAVEVERGGKTMAWLPFVASNRYGLRKLGQPQLTQTLGPWIRDTGAGYTKTLTREMALYTELIDKLPRFDLFRQNFAPEVTNWLPFYWKGFTETTRYTYTIDLSRPLDDILLQFDKRNRRQLREAQKTITAGPVSDLSELLNLNDLTFARQGLKTPYSHDYVHAIDEAVRAHATRWAIIARDNDSGDAHAGIYMVEFAGRVYSLLSGADPEVRGRNGGIVARWAAIKAVHGSATILDLQGSMLAGVEPRNRNYGARQTPYFSVTGSSGKGSLALAFNRLRRG